MGAALHLPLVLVLIPICCVLAFSAAALGAACESSAEFERLDFAEDVSNISAAVDWDATNDPWMAAYPELDIIQVRSCLEGGQIVSTMRLRGNPVMNDSSVQYSFTLLAPGEEPLEVWAWNGTATPYPPDGQNFSLTVDGSIVAVGVPISQFHNISEGWTLECRATLRLGWHQGGTAASFSDRTSTTLSGNHLPGPDLADQGPPEGGPSVSISRIVVENRSGDYALTVEGTTTGAVAEMRVALLFGETPLQEEVGYWVGPGDGVAAGNASLEMVGSNWGHWRFTFHYNYTFLAGQLGIYLLFLERSLVEVRALDRDGGWGHANATFEALPPASVSGAGPKQDPPFAVIGAGAAAGGVAIVVAFALRWRKNRRLLPGVAPPQGGSPQLPPPQP